MKKVLMFFLAMQIASMSFGQKVAEPDTIISIQNLQMQIDHIRNDLRRTKQMYYIGAAVMAAGYGVLYLQQSSGSTQIAIPLILIGTGGILNFISITNLHTKYKKKQRRKSSYDIYGY